MGIFYYQDNFSTRMTWIKQINTDFCLSTNIHSIRVIHVLHSSLLSELLLQNISKRLPPTFLLAPAARIL